MRRASPQAAETAPQNLPENYSQAEGIRNALAGTRSALPHVRDDAFWYLRNLGPDGMNALLQIVQQERDKRRVKRRRLVWIAGIYAAVLILWVAIALLFNGHLLMFMSTFSGLSSIFGATMVFSQTHRSAVRALSDFDDIRVTGAAVEALQMKDKEVYGLASRALCRLLPRLRASDEGILDAEQRAILNKVLPRAARHQPDLALAILAALGQVGDETSVPAVTALAAAPPRLRILPAVVAAARDCLPLLEQRATAQETSRQLLRPSQGSGREDSLLRAAAAAESDRSALLLPSAETPTATLSVETNSAADAVELRLG